MIVEAALQENDEAIRQALSVNCLCPIIWLMRDLADQTNRSASIGYFEQVAIRITKVERHQRLRGTSPLHRTQKESNILGVKVRDHVLKRHRCQKAEVGRARSRMLSLWLDFFPPLMEIDFLIPELQRLTPLSKGDDLHFQDTRIELTGGLNILHSEDKVV
jgi:hypothetical protein